MTDQVKMDRGMADLLIILLYTYEKENIIEFWNSVISGGGINY